MAEQGARSARAQDGRRRQAEPRSRRLSPVPSARLSGLARRGVSAAAGKGRAGAPPGAVRIAVYGQRAPSWPNPAFDKESNAEPEARSETLPSRPRSVDDAGV